MSLKRDIKRYIRENAGATFADVTREALRWMREDSCPDFTAEQLQAVPRNDSLHRLETQIAALSTETASLKQQLQHQSHYRASPSQGNEAGPPPDRDVGSSPPAGPLTAASLSNAEGGQRSRGAILWHPAGRHRHFGEKMSRRSGPGRQGAH